MLCTPDTTHPATDSWVPRVNRTHALVRQRQGMTFDLRELTDGEVYGETTTTIVLPSSTRV